MILRSLECQFLTIALCDAAEPWQLGSQDAATPMMQGIIDLHHDIFFFLILILVFVSRMLVRALWHFNEPIPAEYVVDAQSINGAGTWILLAKGEGVDPNPQNPTEQLIDHIRPPEDEVTIKSDLASWLDADLAAEGMGPPTNQSCQEFVDHLVGGLPLYALQAEWVEYMRLRRESLFLDNAIQVRAEIEGAEREPSPPPPVEDQQGGAGEAGTSGGPSESRKRRIHGDDSDSDSSNSSGGDGGNPAPPGNSPSPDEGGGEIASFIGDLF